MSLHKHPRHYQILHGFSFHLFSDTLRSVGGNPLFTIDLTVVVLKRTVQKSTQSMEKVKTHSEKDGL